MQRGLWELENFDHKTQSEALYYNYRKSVFKVDVSFGWKSNGLAKQQETKVEHVMICPFSH